MSAPVQLALGTVQFGMRYGVAGAGSAVPEAEVKKILAAAWDGGIRMLDTATAYGDIEQRLSKLAQGLRFEIVSKIPALPAAVGSAEHVRRAIATIFERLGDSVRAVLFHRGADLASDEGESAWTAARAALSGKDLKLGVSCYSPAELGALCERFPISVAQLPGNALDQRLQISSAPVEIHLRSAFLQGLLLMPPQVAIERVPGAAAALRAWHRWCDERGLSALQAALNIVKGLPGVRYCVVGVDSLSQLQQIQMAWDNATAMRAPELAVQSEDVIDPRRWR